MSNSKQIQWRKRVFSLSLAGEGGRGTRPGEGALLAPVTRHCSFALATRHCFSACSRASGLRATPRPSLRHAAFARNQRLVPYFPTADSKLALLWPAPPPLPVGP